MSVELQRWQLPFAGLKKNARWSARVFLLACVLAASPAAALELLVSPRASVTAGQITYSPSVIHAYVGGARSVGLRISGFRLDVDGLLGYSFADFALDLGQNERNGGGGGGFPWHNQIFASGSWRLPLEAPIDVWLGGGIGMLSTYFNGGDVVGIASHPAVSFDTRLRYPLLSWLDVAADFRVPLGVEPSLMPTAAFGIEAKLGEP